MQIIWTTCVIDVYVCYHYLAATENDGECTVVLY